MKIKKSGQLITTHLVETKAPFIAYDCFDRMGFLKNAFSTRLGGVSTGCFESMNFSVTMGDDPENVRKNFEIFLGENGFENPVMSAQTHTTNVLRVGREDVGAKFCDVDGLITDEKNVTLVTSYADCVPLYFADPVKRAIGLSHSGWRGTVGRMGEITVKKMEEEFGSKASDIVAAIGPSICASCYEVDEVVAEQFRAALNADSVKIADIGEIVPQNMDHILYEKNDGKYMLNLWAANHKVLRLSGIKEENIHIPDTCTCCNKDLLFSHRGHQGRRGNMCAFFSLT